MSIIDSVYLPEMTPKMYEDIEDNGGMRRYYIEDYDMRRHCVKTMEREDLVVLLFSFSSLLSHRNHRTVKWGPSEQSQSD